MLLPFTKLKDDQRVGINPWEVESVEEDVTRVAGGALRKIAKIKMASGDKFTVFDEERNAAEIINWALTQVAPDEEVEDGESLD